MLGGGFQGVPSRPILSHPGVTRLFSQVRSEGGPDGSDFPHPLSPLLPAAEPALHRGLSVSALGGTGWGAGDPKKSDLPSVPLPSQRGCPCSLLASPKTRRKTACSCALKVLINKEAKNPILLTKIPSFRGRRVG